MTMTMMMMDEDVDILRKYIRLQYIHKVRFTSKTFIIFIILKLN